jgi:hypothetical protein
VDDTPVMVVESAVEGNERGDQVLCSEEKTEKTVNF